MRYDFILQLSDKGQLVWVQITTFTGLGSGLNLTLQNNGVDTIAVTSNGTFAFPTANEASIPVTPTQLAMILGGLDPAKARERHRYKPSE